MYNRKQKFARYHQLTNLYVKLRNLISCYDIYRLVDTQNLDEKRRVWCSSVEAMSGNTNDEAVRSITSISIVLPFQAL
jgi:hypothetical protein